MVIQDAQSASNKFSILKRISDITSQIIAQTILLVFTKYKRTFQENKRQFQATCSKIKSVKYGDVDSMVHSRNNLTNSTHARNTVLLTSAIKAKGDSRINISFIKSTLII